MSAEFVADADAQEPLQNPESLSTFIVNAIRIGMVFGPSIGYFAQMREIRVTHNCEGFAPLLSLILLGSNTLRIYYWIGARFDIALLCQAIVMILVQSGLVYVVLHAQMVAYNSFIASKNGGNGVNTSVGSIGSPQSGAEPVSVTGIISPTTGAPIGDYSNVPRTLRQVFRQALSGPFAFLDTLTFSPFPSSFQTMTPALFYTKFVGMVIMFGVVTGIIYGIGGWEQSEMIGYAALMVEGCLYLPQIHLNYTRKSTAGLTWVLLCTWCLGDVAKLLYFILDNQPFPFIVCSCFQLSCDAVQLSQVFLYRHNKGHRPHDISTVVGGGGAAAVDISASSEMSTLRNPTSGQPNHSGASSTTHSDAAAANDLIVSRGQYSSGGSK